MNFPNSPDKNKSHRLSKQKHFVYREVEIQNNYLHLFLYLE